MRRNIELGDEVNTNINTTVEDNHIHVRHDGISNDISLNDLELGADTPDIEVKNITANWLDLEEDAFEKYVIERHENGDMTLRPEAVFGKS
jgi:hypothetical protein